MIRKLIMRTMALTAAIVSTSTILYWFIAMALYGRVILVEPDPVILGSEIVLAVVLVIISAWTFLEGLLSSFSEAPLKSQE